MKVEKNLCLTDEEIEDYLSGDFGGERIKEMGYHLSICLNCSERKEDIERDIQIEEENDDLIGWSYKSLHKEI